MAEKPAKDNREMGNIGPVEAYDILLRRNINGDRLLSERTNIFLAASSILFLAFVMLHQPPLASFPWIKWLRIALPIIGGFITFLFRSFALQSTNALQFYWHAQENIEITAPEFAYMREKGITPWKDGRQFREGEKEWRKNGEIYVAQDIKKWRWLRKPYLIGKLSKCWLPLAFGLLWLTSLVLTSVELRFN